jgi:hypothetical protein
MSIFVSNTYGVSSLPRRLRNQQQNAEFKLGQQISHIPAHESIGLPQVFLSSSVNAFPLSPSLFSTIPFGFTRLLVEERSSSKRATVLDTHRR